MSGGTSDLLRDVERHRRAVEEQPASAIARLNLGTALLRAGHLVEAEAEFRRALAVDPDLPEALVNLGGIHLSRWEFRECVAVNRRAAECRPEFLSAHYNEGLGHLYLGEADQVVSCFRRVLEQDPGHGGGHYYLAVGLLELGKIQESREHLDRALAAGFSPEPEFLKALERKEGLAAGSQEDGEPGVPGPRITKEEESGDVHAWNGLDRS
jgi:tetratricopeptide (TPR) repeat protein